MEAMRKLPIGIQTFEEIRKEGYLYVDKTAFVYQLVSSGKPYFLSRPRRFGKSLFLTTLESYFQGRKDLFEGLAIERLEKDWIAYPVLHMDLNAEKYDAPERLVSMLNRYLTVWEETWGKNSCEETPSDRFAGIIRRAYERTGRPVVVLIDEYDKPLLQALLDAPLLEEYEKRGPLPSFRLPHGRHEIRPGERLQRPEPASGYQYASEFRVGMRHHQGGVAACVLAGTGRDGAAE